MATTDSKEVCNDILNGVHDDNLDKIAEVTRRRRKMLARHHSAENFATIHIGARVRLKDIRPQYMIGETATVVDKKLTKLVVALDNPKGRFQRGGGQQVTVPAGCVELIEDEE